MEKSSRFNVEEKIMEEKWRWNWNIFKVEGSRRDYERKMKIEWKTLQDWKLRKKMCKKNEDGMENKRKIENQKRK